jgi:flagellar biogenesis protein FliO
MKITLLPVIFFYSLMSTSAWAIGPVQFQKGVVRLVNGAADSKNRSMWIRGQSVALVFPGNGIPSQVIKTDDPLIREIRFSSRGNRIELELKLVDRAENHLTDMNVQPDKRDLLLYFGELPSNINSEPNTAEQSPRAAGISSSIKTSPSKAKFPANAQDSPPLGQAKESASPSSNLNLWPKQNNWGNMTSKDSSSGSAVIWIFMMVVCMAGGYVWWTRRQKKGLTPNTTHIDILSTRALSAKHRLMIVDAAGELLLLGCTERDIRLLKSLKCRISSIKTGSSHPIEDHSLEEEIEKYKHRDTVISAERAAAKTNKVEDSRPISPSTSETLRFVERLTQQIHQHKNPPQIKAEEEPQPLDEHWAEGILKLRRSSRKESPAPTETLH